MDIDYATPSVFTTVSPEQIPLTEDLPEDPLRLTGHLRFPPGHGKRR